MLEFPLEILTGEDDDFRMELLQERTGIWAIGSPRRDTTCGAMARRFAGGSYSESLSPSASKSMVFLVAMAPGTPAAASFSLAGPNSSPLPVSGTIG